MSFMKGIMEWTSPLLRLTKWLENHSPSNSLERKMDLGGGRVGTGRKRNVFKGSVLVSILLQAHPRRFTSRASATQFGKRLLREGHIKSIFGNRTFEDSAQLYMWLDDDEAARHQQERDDVTARGGAANMTSSPADALRSQRGRGGREEVGEEARGRSQEEEEVQRRLQRAGYESLRHRAGKGEGEAGDGETRYERLDARLVEDVRSRVLNRTEAFNIVTSYNSFFQELQRDFGNEGASDRDGAHSYYNAPPLAPTQQQQHQQQQGQQNQLQPQLAVVPQQQQSPEHYYQQLPRHQASPSSPQRQRVAQQPQHHSHLQQQQQHHSHPRQQQQQPSYPQTPRDRFERRGGPVAGFQRQQQQQDRQKQSGQQQQPQSRPTPNTRTSSIHTEQQQLQQYHQRQHHAQPRRLLDPDNGASLDGPAVKQQGSARQEGYGPGEGEVERQRDSACSTDSSLDTQTYFRTRDRNSNRRQQQPNSSTTGSIAGQGSQALSSSQTAENSIISPAPRPNRSHQSQQHQQQQHLLAAFGVGNSFSHKMSSPATSFSAASSHHRDHYPIPEESFNGHLSSSDPSVTGVVRAVPTMAAGLPSGLAPSAAVGMPTIADRDRSGVTTSSDYDVTSAGTLSSSHPPAMLRMMMMTTTAAAGSSSHSTNAASFMPEHLSLMGGVGAGDSGGGGSGFDGGGGGRGRTSNPGSSSAAGDGGVSNRLEHLLPSGVPTSATSSVTTTTPPPVYPRTPPGPPPQPHNRSSPPSALATATSSSLSSTLHDHHHNLHPQHPAALAGAMISPSRWPHMHHQEPTAAYPYSDNEKQLIEEMKRMKLEHEDILRTYEGRINKLMAKMHELRNIAEMLENSSTKTSAPFAVLPARATLFNIIASGTQLQEGDKRPAVDGDAPPPLPPRPGRTGRVYPNKPIIHTRTRMKALPWNRIILGESGTEGQPTSVWHGMQESRFDTEEIERLYSSPPDPSVDDVTLLDDIYAIRGHSKHQLLAMFDAERSQRILTEMRNLRASLGEVVRAIGSLDCQHLHQDSFAELLELLNSPRDVGKILHHVKRKGAGQLDIPEYLIFEISKLDHFQERLEFLRFKNKLQINLFEIDQQLRELNTACDELLNNVPLKNVLETILALGNYLNGGTERGQADGFTLDVLNKLKDFVDRSRRGNLLEMVMRTYCLLHESDLDFGCPTRFGLPEPSNMRHAAQVSFDEIQKALKDLREELSQVRDRLEVLSKRETTSLTIALRVTSENFLTSAVEVLAEEKRFLEDTKSHFWKTTSYFMYKTQSTPQEFFLIWATFLHDCKYYWKLAHRNLARIKFERDFLTKCQLSCSSLPGFRQLKHQMMRTVASLQNDVEMRASKAQQLQHINNWIQSLGTYDSELQNDQQRESLYGNEPPVVPYDVDSGSHRSKHRHHDTHRPGEQGGAAESGGQGAGRSPSPKPITSTPPNVHKPQPISHVSPAPTVVPNTGSNYDGHGMNAFVPDAAGNGAASHQASELYSRSGRFHQPFQSDEMDGFLAASTATDVLNNEGSSVQKKNINFSLMSWLKRDQRPQQPTDNQDVSPFTVSSQTQPQMASPPAAKSPIAATTPFNKLRQSVVQKLSGGSSSKKGDGSSKQSGAAASGPVKPPRTYDDDTPSSHQILFSPQQQQQVQDHTARPSDAPDYDYQNFYQNHAATGSAGRPQAGHDTVPSTLSSVTSKEFSPTRQDVQALGDDSDFRDGSRGLQDRSGNRNYPTDDSGPLPSPSSKLSALGQDGLVTKDGRGRSRAPIALNLGSNMSISDVYGHNDEDKPQQVQQQQQDGAETAYPNGPAREGASALLLPAQPSNADWKRVKATSVPVYKAKLIPNYENQTKLDPRLEQGIRGQAEPLTLPQMAAHFSQPRNSSEVYRQELLRKSELYIHNYPQSPQSPNVPPTAVTSNVQQMASSSIVEVQQPPQAGYSPQAGPGSNVNKLFAGAADHSYPPSFHIAQSPLGSQNQASTTQSRGTSHRGMSRGDDKEVPGPVNPSSPHYDDFQVPARRAASVQDMLDHRIGPGIGGRTDAFGTDVSRHSHTSDPSGPSHAYPAHLTSSPVAMAASSVPGNSFHWGSRGRSEERQRGGGGEVRGSSGGGGGAGEPRGKDPAGRDKTPESGLANQAAKVSDLIHRWERKQATPEEVLGTAAIGGPLMGGQDKAPSMTSTPVARRKNASGPAAAGVDEEKTADAGSQGKYMRRGSNGNLLVNGVGPVLAGSRSRDQRSRSQPRGERDPGASNDGNNGGDNAYPHTTTPGRGLQNGNSSQWRERNPRQPGPSDHGRSHAHPFNVQQQRPAVYPPQQHQQQQQPAFSATNTYPPRAAHMFPGGDNPDSYSQQLRKASTLSGAASDKGGGRPSKPVPLPRSNVPGAMAVVKPTLHQQQQQPLAFMDI